MRYKGILFDFNGTLFRDSEKHEEAWNIMARKLRGRPFTPEEFKIHMHGRENPEIISYLLGCPVPRGEALAWGERKESIYRELCLRDPAHLHLAPGAEDLLGFLAKEGVPRAIATSSERTNVRFYIEQFHLLRWFSAETILFADGSFPAKPAPDIYLRAAALLGLPPEECIVCEDSASGLLAARHAGAGLVIAVSQAGGEPAAGSPADLILPDFISFDRLLLTSRVN